MRRSFLSPFADIANQYSQLNYPHVPEVLNKVLNSPLDLLEDL